MPQPQITSTTLSAGNITIIWTGGGTLESATELKSSGTVWTTTGDNDGSYTGPVGTGNRYYRVNR